jgi:hypothetical protein
LPANATEVAHTTAKTSRLPRTSAISGACTLSPAVPSRSGPIAYV